jgi:hypothetical protein
MTPPGSRGSALRLAALTAAVVVALLVTAVGWRMSGTGRGGPPPVDLSPVLEEAHAETTESVQIDADDDDTEPPGKFREETVRIKIDRPFVEAEAPIPAE